MLSENSILTRLPQNLDRKQAIFLDGIRHAAEFASLAYERLAQSLTLVATTDIAKERRSHCYTSIFIDAWAIVDAFDRFRLLDKQFPGSGARVKLPNAEIRKLVDTARKLRNVADHLAGCVDLVVSKKGTALGVLTWVTLSNADGESGAMCALVPGGVPDGEIAMVNAADEAARYPTDLIHLTAGGRRLSLSKLVAHMAKCIESIEQQLEMQLPHNSEKLARATDMLVKFKFELVPE